VLRQARWSVVWGLGAFVALQVAVLAAMETRWGLRDPEYARKAYLLRQRLAERPDAGPVVLLLGSSRTAMGVRPACLPPCRTPAGHTPLVFNFGMCRAGAMLELLCLRRLLADGIRPNVVLVEVWWPWLHRNEACELELPRLRWRDVAVVRRYHDRPDVLQSDWYEDQLPPHSLQRFVRRKRLAPDWLPEDTRKAIEWEGVDDWGWLRAPHFYHGKEHPHWPIWVSNTRQALAPLLGPLPVDPAMDRALRELLDVCRREGIAAHLVLLPDGFHREYPAEGLALLDDYLGRLQRDTGVGVLDLRDWAPPEDFNDGIHLTHATAVPFTERLGREVLAPLLAGRRPDAYRPAR
jgi:hypothetical protein